MRRLLVALVKVSRIAFSKTSCYIALAVMMLLEAMLLDMDKVGVIASDLDRNNDQMFNRECSFPCTCSDSNSAPAKCRAGVERVKDGCDCCYMCARQQGDVCGYREKCDEGLYCQREHGSGTGICRARSGTPCDFEGERYRDGEEFEPDCRRLCTCQNGVVSCTSSCPHEEVRPQSACAHPQLMDLGNCCKEWVCATHQQQYGITNAMNYTPPPSTEPPHKRCRTPQEASMWGQCSVTCGIGVSRRLTTDPHTCEVTYIDRICMIRPCATDNTHPDHTSTSTTTSCSPATRKSEERIKFTYQDCESEQQYKPLFCTECSPKCCMPAKTGTRNITMLCGPDHVRRVVPVMRIRTCVCEKKMCYG